MIKQAKLKQRSIVVTLLDLKNAFGEVHHSIIPVVLKHHHVPEEIVNIVKSLYVQFHTTVTTSRFSTEFLPVSKGVLQGDCLSPLLFNLLFNTLIQLTPPQSRCSYSILHLKLFNIFTKNITKRSSETAKLHQENGGQYGYRHKHRNIFKAG